MINDPQFIQSWLTLLNSGLQFAYVSDGVVEANSNNTSLTLFLFCFISNIKFALYFYVQHLPPIPS